jgi:uncharacterized protein (DUF58 family)
VGVIFFTDQVEKYIPPKKGSAHIWRVIKEIFTFVPKGKGTDIASALEFYSRISKKRSFVFILSDFLGKEYGTALKIARQKHEPVGIRIYDEGAFHLPLKGIVRFSDFETGKTLVFDAYNRTTKDRFFKAKQGIHQETLDIFSKAKTDLINLKTNDSISDTLTQYFRLRERRLR